MKKCRICLGIRTNLCSIYDSHQGLSFASMIAFITGNKTLGNNELICLLCRRKLRDLYEFKLLIERSDLELCKQSKVLKFSTIDDNKVEFDLQLNCKKLVHIPLEYNNLFQNEDNSIYYKNTLIRRLIKQEMNTVPAKDFLDIIDQQKNSHISDGGKIEDEYYHKRKKKLKVTKEYKNKIIPGPLKIVQNVLVKPIFLSDVRLLKTKPQSNLQKRKVKLKKRKRQDALCPFCGIISKNVKTHILTHTAEKKVKCPRCPKLFCTKASLKNHMKSHSEQKESYECEHCIATFTKKSSIRIHMATHVLFKQFSCTICKKEFKWKSGLQRHMKIHVIGPKAFQCDSCCMGFTSHAARVAHRRVHTGERPYRCEICSQPYSYKRDFNRHCLKKHAIVVDRRPVYVLDHDILKREKALMKDLMLRLQGRPTEAEPMDHFQGPQKAQAFATAVKMMQNGQIPIDVHL